MAEHRRDRFQAHATVDRLRRQRVAQLVRVHVSEAGGGGDTGDDASDAVPIQQLSVVQQTAVHGRMPCGPVGEQTGGVGMQRHVAVVVQFADRDPQPWCAVELDHSVALEGAQLAGAHPGAR